MENFIFIILMIGSFVINYLLKKNKKAKQKRPIQQSQSSVQSESIADFDQALQRFSNKISLELREAPSTPKGVYNTPIAAPLILEAEEDDLINSGLKRNTNYKIKKKKQHNIISSLKSPAKVKEAVIASEILKTKF